MHSFHYSSPVGRPGRMPRGLVHLEVLFSIGLTLALLALFAAALLSYAAARKENDLRRTLQLAACAELDRVRAGLRPPPALGTQPERAAQPGQTLVSLGADAGAGNWAGLTRLRVLASKHVGAERIVCVELQTYIPSGIAP